MRTFSNMSLKELVEIREILENEELLAQFYQELKRKEHNIVLPGEYQSNRLPSFYKGYQEQCNRLIIQLNRKDIPFLINKAFHDVGNNYVGHIYLNNSVLYKELLGSLAPLEKFFEENSENILDYEGIYNTLNYIKTYICNCLYEGEKIETKEDLFCNFDEKRKLVLKNIKTIAEELIKLRSQLPNSRLCIANHGLIKMMNKTGYTMTRNQDDFISAVAFGSTLRRLKEEDYKEAERLLFIPQKRR